MNNKESQLLIWREALAHLRHLSDDVLKGLCLFLSLNAVILGAVLALAAYGSLGRRRLCLLALLSCLGFVLTLGARFILRRNRIYYLEMLAKKSLIECEAGFYDTKLAGSNADLAFPWRLKPGVVSEIARDFDGWVQRSIRSRGTIARVYFLIYEGLLLIYALALLVTLVRFVR